MSAASRVWPLSLVLVACLPTSSAAPERRAATSESAGRAQRAERVRLVRTAEAALRQDFAPLEQAPWIDASGADPYRLVKRRGGGFVGILRGAKALVVLDDALGEQQRFALAEAPTSLCVSGRNAWVGSRWASSLLRVDLANGARSDVELSIAGVADVACGDDADALHVLGADDSALVTLDERGKVIARRPALAGGLRLLRRGQFLLELSLFERSLRVLELSAAGVPEREIARIAHDGPIWAVDALARGDALLVALSGVEDKPLVRAHGEFENIDSFAWIYQVDSAGAKQLTSLNVGELGLILPKALSLFVANSVVELRALAAGSGRSLRARWSTFTKAPALAIDVALPGATDAVFDGDRVSYASPLFDAWVRLEPSGVRVVDVDPAMRPASDVRLGEALFFTELMAPWNISHGTHSRFTCETCHFEGGVDGRTHFTGRGDVSVVTKPLFGLANNRPHFSRARDPDLSSVSHNEFRVAGAGSGEDPWFSLETARYPWLYWLGVQRAELSPLELRTALLRFLYAFSHAPNERSLGRTSFTALEAEGARSFRSRCATCHAARLLSDEPSSEAPFERWESLVLRRSAPLVWARGEHEKTGVLPYVDERGTRITSLRRLSLKPRYFTNGSAPTLDAVLERFRDGQHAAAPDAPGALDWHERRALLAFLRLL